MQAGDPTWLNQYPVLFILIYAGCHCTKHRNDLQEPPEVSRAWRTIPLCIAYILLHTTPVFPSAQTPPQSHPNINLFFFSCRQEYQNHAIHFSSLFLLQVTDQTCSWSYFEYSIYINMLEPYKELLADNSKELHNNIDLSNIKWPHFLLSYTGAILVWQLIHSPETHSFPASFSTLLYHPLTKVFRYTSHYLFMWYFSASQSSSGPFLWNKTHHRSNPLTHSRDSEQRSSFLTLAHCGH